MYSYNRRFVVSRREVLVPRAEMAENSSCYFHAPSQLTQLNGTIFYNSTSQTDSCTWTLPLESRDNYVVVLKVEEIGLWNKHSNRCSGLLYLPGFRLCVRSACRIYESPRSTCDVGAFRNSVCFQSHWRVRKEVMKYIMMDAVKPDVSNYRNHFKLSYQIIDCPVREYTAASSTTTWQNEKTAESGTTRNPSKAHLTNMSAVSLHTSVVLGVLLLIACVVILVLSYRLRKQTAPENADLGHEDQQSSAIRKRHVSTQREEVVNVVYNLELQQEDNSPENGIRRSEPAVYAAIN